MTLLSLLNEQYHVQFATGKTPMIADIIKKDELLDSGENFEQMCTK